MTLNIEVTCGQPGRHPSYLLYPKIFAGTSQGLALHCVEGQRYLKVTCTEGCTITYHFTCWRRLERVYRVEHPEFNWKVSVAIARSRNIASQYQGRCREDLHMPSWHNLLNGREPPLFSLHKQCYTTWPTWRRIVTGWSLSTDPL